MRSRKPAFILLLCCGFSACTVGCATVDAFVGSSAKHFGSGSSQRFAAIANALRIKGRDSEAKLTYQEALKAEPETLTGRDHLNHLASIGRLPRPNADDAIVAEAGLRSIGQKEPVLTRSDLPESGVESGGRSVRASKETMLAEPVTPPLDGVIEKLVTRFPRNAEERPIANKSPEWNDKLDGKPESSAVQFVSATNQKDDRKTIQNTLHEQSSRSEARAGIADLAGLLSPEPRLFADETAEAAQSQWRTAPRSL